MRPRFAGGGCATLESVLTHDFFHYCYRETRAAEGVMIAVASIMLGVSFLYREARTADFLGV